MKPRLQLAIDLLIGGVFAIALLGCLLFFSAASAATWGAMPTFWLLVLGLLGFVGLCQRPRSVSTDRPSIPQVVPLTFDEECAAVAAGGGPLSQAFAPACVAVGRWMERRAQRAGGAA